MLPKTYKMAGTKHQEWSNTFKFDKSRVETESTSEETVIPKKQIYISNLSFFTFFPLSQFNFVNSKFFPINFYLCYA